MRLEVVEVLRRHALAHARPGWRAGPSRRCCRARRCPVMSGGRAPVAVGDLHDHVVLLAVALEARHRAPAEQRLERAAHRLHRGTPTSADLLAVHAHRARACSGAGRVSRFMQARASCERLLDQRVDVALQHLDRAPASSPRTRTGRLRGDCPSDGGLIGKASTPGMRLQLRHQLARDLLLLARALVPGLEAQRRRCRRRRVGMPAIAMKRSVSGISAIDLLDALHVAAR